MASCSKNQDEFQSSQLQNSRLQRRVYLVTYSKASLEKFPTRESFGYCVEEAFNGGTGKVKVVHWASCMEKHKDDTEHYHVSLKLSNCKKWKSVKEKLQTKHDIVVNFSDNHVNYLSAYRYVTKQDKNVYHSKNHPNLKNVKSPASKKGTIANRRASLQRVAEKTNASSCTTTTSLNTTTPLPPKAKRQRLSRYDVSEFLLTNGIHGETELMAVANQRKQEGQTDLAEFILNNNSKTINEIIENTWKMQNAGNILTRQNKPRMDLIRETVEKGICPDQCQWLECARQVLSQNDINIYVYAAALRELLTKGRGKHRNLLIIGPANSGKTFLLKPLELIFNCFVNPANDKYAWVGAEKSELILMQDFRWTPELISWKDMLLLLEGESVHLPAPRNQYKYDVCIDSDIPVFATSKNRIEYVGKFNSRDDRETEMMEVRWKVIEFNQRILEIDQKVMTPCAKCFSKLVLIGENA